MVLILIIGSFSKIFFKILKFILNFFIHGSLSRSPTSLGGFSPASLLKLLNPNDLKDNPDNFKPNLDYMYNYVYIIYDFLKILDEPL